MAWRLPGLSGAAPFGDGDIPRHGVNLRVQFELLWRWISPQLSLDGELKCPVAILLAGRLRFDLDRAQPRLEQLNRTPQPLS